ncbi:hypothetical protein GN244_ATG16327 [Phytophthora infestans]|uniref:Uncharacterized protein n=1 Tax=Phytophthora infestans TaxID=4787 RepID=A0A833SL86_PHYIN|nr:hypothetical protein GN244_ATG16327 [Phytophthora infestans]KAF4135971.1 hypothetical protein GN958_ATG14836 [Phytophthora infestans]
MAQTVEINFVSTMMGLNDLQFFYSYQQLYSRRIHTETGYLRSRVFVFCWTGSATHDCCWIGDCDMISFLRL